MEKLYNKNKIFITGAGGFLGKRLVKQLTSQKNYVLFIERLDLLNPKTLQLAIDQIKPDIIIHLAAYVNLSRDFTVAAKCIDVNVNGTLNLLNALIKYPPAKLIMTSTEEIYNNNLIPFSENTPFNPPSSYSVSKIASEYLCQQYARELNYSLTIFRLATFYGPENPPHRLIPQIIIHSLKNQDILLNSGNKKRDYLYVDDVVDAFEKTLKKRQKQQIEIINLGGGKSYTLKALINKIIRISNSRSKVVYNAYPDRINEVNHWLLDITKAKKLLGWKPITSLDEGLKKTITYFRINYL